jgi:VRR-NUC domain
MGIKPYQLSDQVIKLMAKADRKEVGVKSREELILEVTYRDERAIQTGICQLLGMHEIPYCRSRMDKRTRTHKGTPDFLFCVGRDEKGQGVAWEVKTPQGRLTADQVKMLEQYMRSGWRVAIIRSVEQALKELRTLQEEFFKKEEK